MNRNFIFVSLALALAVNIAIIGCHRKGDNESTINPDSMKAAAAVHKDSLMPAPDTTKNPYANSLIEVKTFKNTTIEGFGYDIYVDKNLRVHQPHIPAVSGNRGFSTEEKAKRAGEFVGNKFRHNIMPPSVNPKELDSLGVL